MKCALVITGHVRDGFQTQSLNKFVNLLAQKYQVDLYLHSWDESEAIHSWRHLDRSNLFEVTTELFEEYFDHAIKGCQIDNEINCVIKGRWKNNVGATSMPIRGWKKMLNSMLRGVELVKNSNTQYDFIIRTRFDYFNRFSEYHILQHHFGPKAVTFEYLLEQIEIQDKNEICFLPENLADPNFNCVDNFYFGDLDKIHSLLSFMTSDRLDAVEQKTREVCQEAYFIRSLESL